MLQNEVLFKRAKISTSRYLKKRELANNNYIQASLTSRKKPLLRTSQSLKVIDSKHSGESELVNWKKHFHFASFPLFTFGNWIPFIMARWPCIGIGCGLMQVAFKNNKGTWKKFNGKRVYFHVAARFIFPSEYTEYFPVKITRTDWLWLHS